MRSMKARMTGCRAGRWEAWGLAVALAMAMAGCGQGSAEAGGREDWLSVERGAVRPWVAVAGVAEPRRVERIASRLQGAGVLVELAEEGARVEPGTVVARFETSQLEQDLARQESEVERARQELASLTGAELPLEVLDLEAQVGEAENALAGEEAFLAAAADLEQRGLMSEGEVARQQERVGGVRARAERSRKRLELTTQSLHPARRAKAEATLAAAEAARDFTKEQLALCEVRSAGGGVVSRMPLPLGGELRPAEVGDTVFRNQVFMALPDIGEMVVEAWLEECDWGRAEVGARAEVRAIGGGTADMVEGQVESIGRIGRGGRYPLRIGLAGNVDWPAGMTVTARVYAPAQENVLRVRRAAVHWSDGQAWVWVPGEGGNSGGEAVRQPIGLGAVDEGWAEVRSGLAEGARYR